MADGLDDSLKLKAAIEFGSEYTYALKNGGLGRTLVVDAETKTAAGIARKKIPSMWEGLYVLVIYSSDPEVVKEEIFYDPALQ
tara:strand:- start:642 stop:890 length:249 start_codon:yes stop_codon:yes gene_type:complete